MQKKKHRCLLSDNAINYFRRNPKRNYGPESNGTKGTTADKSQRRHPHQNTQAGNNTLPNETLRWGPEGPRVTSSWENSSDRRDRKPKAPARVTWSEVWSASARRYSSLKWPGHARPRLSSSICCNSPDQEHGEGVNGAACRRERWPRGRGHSMGAAFLRSSSPARALPTAQEQWPKARLWLRTVAAPRVPGKPRCGRSGCCSTEGPPAPARPHAASGTQEDTDDHLKRELCQQALSSRDASTSAWGGLQADPRVESVHTPDHLMGWV